MRRTPVAALLSLAALLAASAPPARAQEFAGGHLFVVAKPNANVEIVELDEAGALVRSFGGSAGMDIGGGLAFGHDGMLYVADMGDTGFYVFDASGSGGVVGNLTLGTSAANLSMAPRGTLYVLGANNGTCIESTLAGLPIRSFDVEPQASSANQILLTADGHLLLSSSSSGLAEFDPAGGFVRQIGAPLGALKGAALNAEGHPLVLASGGAVTEIDAAGNVIVSFGGAAGLASPTAIALGSDGFAYVADVSVTTNAIFRVAESGSGGKFSEAGLALKGARGLAFAPYRFDAKIVGKLVQQGAKPIPVNEPAVLTWYPGFPSAFVSLVDGASNADLATAFGAPAWVYSGFLARDDKPQIRRRFLGSEITEKTLAAGAATIDLLAQGKLTPAGFFAPSRATAAITRVAPGAVFSGKLVTTKLRK